MVLRQHRVLLSKTISLRASCGVRCMGHVIRTWSAVCLMAPHTQFGEGARHLLNMDEWNRSTPIGRRLSLTKAVLASSSQQVWHWPGSATKLIKPRQMSNVKSNINCRSINCCLINYRLINCRLINCLVTGPGYKNTKPGCILAVRHVPSTICPLRRAGAKFGNVV